MITKNRLLLLLLSAAMTPLISLNIAHAEKKSLLLHSFSGADGIVPNGVVRGVDGTLYGTAGGGGEYGGGTIFKMTPDGQFTTLYAFNLDSGGDYPTHAPTLDSKGNLYGATCCNMNDIERGVVWELTPDGTYTVLHSFEQDPVGGGMAINGVALDKKGNVYGASFQGGTNNVGVIFKVTPTGSYKVLYNFTGADGAAPSGAPFIDKHGNVFGTTGAGGRNDYGTIYELAPDGTETVLYSFTGQDDGAVAVGLARDDNGNFYGTTQEGGANNAGTLFKFSPSGTLTVLHNFAYEADDGWACNPPTIAKSRKGEAELYGFCLFGGTENDGVAYKLSAKGQYKIIHNFTGGLPGSGHYSDAGQPAGSPVIGSDGKLYGAAHEGGGKGDGTVFDIR